MELDIREMMANAQRQSDEFMRQSREQARLQLESQRMTVAGTSGGGMGGGGYPSTGTPAGRMLDTITQLVQRGVSTGGGVVSGAFGAGMGQVGALGGMAGGLAVAPIDLGGAMFTTQQRNMRFMQTFATAQGFGFARQRMDMTSMQAAEMAQEELSSRMTRGWRRGVMGAFNAASFGTLGYMRRLYGQEQAWEGREDIAAGLQQQMRYVRRSTLDRAGMEDYAGPFPTGITREGARDMARQMSQDVYAPLQQQYGLTGKELTTVQARAMGTMGRQGVEDLLGPGRTVKSGLLGRQMRGVIEVQQALNISAEEADQFWGMVGQMHSTAERIAQKTRQVRRTAGALGLGTREAMQGIMEFERLGVQTGMGADRARAVAENYTQSLYETYRRGGISGEQMMRYGGSTPEEGLRRQMQARFQENIGMWAGGAGMMGVGVLAGDRKAWGQMTGGSLGFMGAMGEVGKAYAQDPFAAQRARFDPAVHQTVGASADRAMFQLARSMPVVGAERQHRVQRLAQFQALTGLSDLDTNSRYSQFEGEEAVAAAMLGVDNKSDAARKTASIYSELVGSGLAVSAANAYGGGSVWEAAKKIYDIKGDSNATVTDILRKQADKPIEAGVAGDIAKQALESDAVSRHRSRSGASIYEGMEVLANSFKTAANSKGFALSASQLNEMVMGGAQGMQVTNEGMTEHAWLSYDEAGKVVVRKSSKGVWEGESALSLGRSREGAWLSKGVSEITTARVQGLLDPSVRSSGDVDTWQQRMLPGLLGAVQRSKRAGAADLEQALFQPVSGLAANLFSDFSAGEDPFTSFMQRVAGMDTNVAAMAKAGVSGLSELQMFSNMYQTTAGGVALQGMAPEMIQAAMGSIGEERLAAVLGESVGATRSMLEGKKGAISLAEKLGETGMARKLFASMLDSIDKSKFNALGSSAANALWVQFKGTGAPGAAEYDANMKPGG